MTVVVRPYRNKQGLTKSWEVDIRFEWGDGTPYRERVRSPVASKSGSEAWGRDRERTLIEQGQRRDIDAARVPTLREFAPVFLSECAARRLKPGSLDAYEKRLRVHLLPALGDVPLDAVSSEALGPLRLSMASHSPRTANAVVVLLGGILTLARERGHAVAALEVERLKVDRARPIVFYDFATYERLVEAARTDPRCRSRPLAPGTHLAVVLLGGDAGLRAGEIAALTWRQVDALACRVTVDRADWKGQVGLPKGGKTRVVPMTPRLAVALAMYRAARAPKTLDDLVFERAGGKRVESDHLRGWLQTLERRAGLPLTRRVHVLRHTFCSHLAMRGADVRAIQELAGHTDLATTLRYMHLVPGHLEAAIARLQPPPASTPAPVDFGPEAPRGFASGPGGVASGPGGVASGPGGGGIVEAEKPGGKILAFTRR